MHQEFLQNVRAAGQSRWHVKLQDRKLSVTSFLLDKGSSSREVCLSWNGKNVRWNLKSLLLPRDTSVLAPDQYSSIQQYICSGRGGAGSREPHLGARDGTSGFTFKKYIYVESF